MTRSRDKSELIAQCTGPEAEIQTRYHVLVGQLGSLGTEVFRREDIARTGTHARVLRGIRTFIFPPQRGVLVAPVKGHDGVVEQAQQTIHRMRLVATYDSDAVAWQVGVGVRLDDGEPPVVTVTAQAGKQVPQELQEQIRQMCIPGQTG